MNVGEIFGQDLENEYIEKLEILKENNGRSEDVVINVKMVERFYSAYNKIEVLPWKDIFLQDNFENVKAYFVAYNNLESEKFDSGELQQELASKKDKIQEERNSELEGSKSLAIITD
jgi:hypothetical protein